VSISLAIVLDAWMMSGEEGKLLAGTAGFLFTLGERAGGTGPLSYDLRFSCHAKRDASHRPLVPAFRLTPIRVREKRMNTYKTAKTARSYQKIDKSICKKSFTTGNLFCWGTYY
jgi:hypothetical protein